MPAFRTSDFEDITPKQAIQMQEKMREKINILPLHGDIETIGGADISFNRGSDIVHAGIVVLSLPSLKLAAYSLVTTEVMFPYIPGLLAYREIPALMEAWGQCRSKPDVLILDGHGIAHPRRMGIATHFGILTDHPTIGCAKNKLTGYFDDPGREKGCYSNLMDNGERVGVVLRSRTDVNPIFVSPGHLTDVESSIRITQMALGKYKLPETTRTAHRLVNKLRQGETEEGYFENPKPK